MNDSHAQGNSVELPAVDAQRAAELAQAVTSASELADEAPVPRQLPAVVRIHCESGVSPMPYDPEENGISPEASEARRKANDAEALVASHQERVRSIAAQLDAAAAAINAKRQERSATGRAFADGDPEAMAAGKRLAAEIEELGRERDVLAAAHEAAVTDLKAAEAALAAARRRVGYEDGKDTALDASGVCETIDEQMRGVVDAIKLLHELADRFALQTGDQSLRRLVRMRYRFSMAMAAAGLREFAEIAPVAGANRITLSDSIGAFLRRWVDSAGEITAASSLAAEGMDPSDVLPPGCRLQHKGQGRWAAFSPDGAQIGGLHMSRLDAIAALQAVVSNPAA